MISINELKEILSYDPETGIFRWKLSVNSRAKAGQIAGTLCQTGSHPYWYIQYNKKRYMLHRLAWLYMTGEFPEKEIDHINGNSTDNRFSNLRDVSKQDNMLNSKRSRKDTCGVYWRKDLEKWTVVLSFKGKYTNFGFFTNKEEAIIKALEIKKARLV